jgi:hypothetical protein
MIEDRYTSAFSHHSREIWAVRKLAASRPCVLRDEPCGALLSMRKVFNGIEKIPHPEEAAPGSARCAARGQAPQLSRRTHGADPANRQFPDRLFRGGDG